MELKDSYKKDFEKIRGALLAQIQNNSKLSEELMAKFALEDYSLLEEHALLSKIILDSTKTLSEAYKQAPDILEKIGKNQPKVKINLDDLMD